MCMSPGFQERLAAKDRKRAMELAKLTDQIAELASGIASFAAEYPEMVMPGTPLDRISAVLNPRPVTPLPPPAGGYVYAIALPNGFTKIGQSLMPEARIKTHRVNAQSLGTEIMDAWVSPYHAGYVESERQLLEEFGGRAGLRECVRVPFAEVVECAKRLVGPASA